jgi:CHAT domain-containing protein
MPLRTIHWKVLIFLSLSLFGGILFPAISMHAGYALTSDAVLLNSQTTLSANLATQAQQAYQTGQYEQARIAWEAAYVQAERRGDRTSQISILNALCTTYQELGNWEKAKLAIQQSLDLLASDQQNTRQDNLLHAQTLNTQGALSLVMGQSKEAYDLWSQAEGLYLQVDDQEGVLGSRINQVQALQAMGLYRQAYFRLTEIQDDVKALPDSSLKVKGLKSLGDVFQITGNLEEAEKILLASVELAEKVGDQVTASSAWVSLGNAYRSFEKYDAAIHAYYTAAKTASSPVAEATASLNEISLLIKLKQWDIVASRLLTLQPLVVSLEPSRTGVYARVNFATNLQTLLHQNYVLETGLAIAPREISQLLATAVEHAKSIDDKRSESYAIGQLGALYEQTQQYDYALELTEQALNLSQKLNARDITYRWQWQKGRILQAKSTLTSGHAASELTGEAIAAYQDAVILLRQIRAELIAADSLVRFSFRDNVEPVYRELVNLLITPNASEDDLRDARQIIEDLQLAELQNFFRSACLDIQAQNIDQIDPTAAIIYPVILPERLVVVTALPGQPLKQHSMPITETDLNQTVTQLLQTLNPVFSNRSRLEVSEMLYQWLVAPIEKDLQAQQIETLVFVPDGSLRNIPMAALYTGKEYLIEAYNVALTPGLQLLPPRNLAGQDTNILAGAITEAHQGFPALPGVASEIEKISATFPTTVFLNEEFTATNLKEEVNQNNFPIVHLATHGQFSSEVNETYLVGWEEPLRIQDFQVLVREQLPQIQQPIELLVLSACQTAEGDERATLGLAGFAVRSGARSTLATLWAVNDQSTSLLVSEFYQQLSRSDMKISKADALRQAQLSLLKSNPDFSHPYYWAPFVLVGNWL